MKLNFLKLKKNRRFNYTPRYYKGKEEASVFNFEGRLVNSRETYNENDRRKIWEDSRNRSRNRKSKELNKTLILIIIILILIFLYIIDFDLSIFYNN